jgi:DNA-binding transcriptional regulator YdaS (Cro superfamily)
MTRSVEALAVARSYPGMPALIRAIELAGSQPLLAQAIGTEPQKVANWLHHTRRVPLEYVPLIVAAVHHPDVTPVTLRPDFRQGWALLGRQLRMPARGREAASEPEEITG